MIIIVAMIFLVAGLFSFKKGLDAITKDAFGDALAFLFLTVISVTGGMITFALAMGVIK